ncbi:MAG: hypothetical protein ABIP81_08770 [Terriglobales bacterium]
MLKVIGTISAVAAAMMVLEKKRSGSVRPTELEMVAAEELRKVLIYAAPPTFLATVSSMDDNGPALRWQERIAN